MVQRRNLIQDSNFPKSYLPQIRGSSWHKNEIKMIRRGHYSINKFQDSNKRKITEKITLNYLPIVIFFNAFELGAESGNQVILTRVNSTNVLDEGLRIGEIGRRMNSKVKSVKQGVYRK
jgi:hypothetical protein